MKRLYTAALLLALMQLIAASPLKRSPSSSNILKSEKQLVKLYDKKVNSTIKKIYKELELINGKILNDEVVQKAATPTMQKLKRNMIDFQQFFPFYENLGWLELLVATFSNMMKDFYNPIPSTDKDALYTVHLMEKLGYDRLRTKYKEEFGKFVSEDILPKFEKIETELSKKSHLTKFDNKLIKWMNRLQECVEYECYLITFRRATLTPRDQFFGYIQRETTNMIIRYANNATKFAYAVYYHPKLRQMNWKFSKVIIEVTMLWIRQYKEMNTISMLDDAYLQVLEHMVDAPLKELDLITTILNESGLGQSELYYKRAHDEFLKHDLLEEFEKFKASLSKEELRREKQLLETVEILKAVTTFMHRNEAFEMLKELDKRKDRRPF